jgi:uncharacterized protein
MLTDTDNISTVKAMYKALGQGDVEAILEAVTDDVDWATDAALPGAPWYGARQGKDAVRGFFAALARVGPITEFTPLIFTTNDEGDVQVLIRYAFTVSATGKSVGMNMHHLFRFRDGKAYYVRSAEDTAQVAAAFTP